MNILESKQLLLSLESNRDKKKPINHQLNHLFVPKLWGCGVVLKNSLNGRLSLWLNKKESLFVREKKVREVFAKAFSDLRNHVELCKEIPLSLRIELHQLLPQTQIQSELNPAPELSCLKKISETCKEEQAENIKKLSILRIDPQGSRNLDLTSFAQLFDATSASHTDFLSQIEAFLKSHPEYASQRMNEHLELIRKAKEFNQSIEKEFFSDAQPLSLETYQAKMKKMAGTMSEVVRKMSSGDKWMFCGSYGKQGSSIQSLFNLVRKLPSEALNELPSPLPTLLQQTELPDPGRFVLEGVHKIFEELGQELFNPEEPLGRKVLEALVKDDARNLPDMLAKKLPDFIGRNLESWLQQGLVGNIMEFVPDGDTREFMLWMAEKGASLKDPEKKAEFIREMETKLVQKVQEPFASVTQSLNQGIGDLFLNAQKTLPGTFQDILGLDALLSFGPFWLEFQKQDDKEYTILVYASGNALNHHPRSSTDLIHWPLRLTNIHADKLNDEFFGRLLYHFIEPRYNPSIEIRSADLYEGVLGYLEAKPDSKQSEEWRSIQSHPSSEKHLIQSLLTKPEVTDGRLLFDLHCEALVDFCRPYLSESEQTLILDDLETCTILEKAMAEIKEEAKALKLKLGDKGDLLFQSIQATETEIKEAIALARHRFSTRTTIPITPLNLPPFILQPLQNLFQSSGLSLNQLKSSKSALCWALGSDEIGDLIDAFVTSVEMLPKGNTSLPSIRKKENEPLAVHKSPRGWLGTLLFSIYFKMAIETLQIAMLLTRYYQYGFSLLIRPAIQWALQQIIPTFIQDWYAEVMRTVQRKIVEITLKVILHSLFSKDTIQGLESLGKDWRNSIQGLAQSMMGTQTIRFNVDSSFPAFQKASIILSTSSKDSTYTSTASPSFPHLYASIPLLESSDVRQSPDNIVEILEKWKVTGQQLSKNEGQIFYLHQRIRSLEVPTKGVENFWDKVKNVEQCLELLSDLAIQLNESTFFVAAVMPKKESKGDRNKFVDRGYGITPYRSPGLYGSSVVMTYQILSIMDRLARRCPDTHLEGYDINGYKILEWLRNKGSQLENLSDLANLRKVCAYFMPDIDLHNLPPPKEIKSRAQKTLFDYSFVSEGLFSQRHYIDYFTVYHSDRFRPEFKYLAERLNDPDIQRKIKTLGYPQDLSERIKMEILFQESFTFTRKDSPISRPYALLRFQVLLGMHMVHQGIFNVYSPDASRSWSLDLKEFKTAPPKDYKIPLKTKSGIFDKLDKLALRCNLKGSWNAYLPHYLGASAGENLSSTRLAYFIAAFLDAPVREQSAIIAHPQMGMLQHVLSIRQVDYEGKPVDLQLQEMIFCEQSDQIIRLWGYLKQHKEKFNAWTIMEIFENALFNIGKLEKQLQESPSIAEAMGETLTEFLDYFETHRSFFTYCKLIHLGLRLQHYCQQIVPAHVHSFPNFKKRLDSSISHWAKNSPHFLLLSALSFKQLPDVLSLEEKREGVRALYRALFSLKRFPIFQLRTIDNGLEFEFLFKIINEFGILFWQWLPTISDLIQDEKFRHELVHTILRDNHFNLPDKDTSHWEFNNSWIVRCGSIEINLLEGIIRGRECFTDQSILSRIKNATTWYLGEEADNLQIISDGILETADGKCRVEIKEQDSKVQFTCKKVIEGKTYCYINHDNLEYNQIFSDVTNYIPQKSEDMWWLEETSSPQKNIIIYRYKTLLASFTVEKESQGETYSLKAVNMAGVTLQHVDNKSVRHILAPLNRFCPLSEIVCWAIPGKSNLQKIDFRPYNLIFDIEILEDELQATNHTLFPDYRIAPQQNHTALEGFASYLLLENQTRQKKVLIPAGQWINAAATRFTSQLGFLGNFAHDYLRQFSQHVQKEKAAYHVYELDEKGQLNSEEPEALTYLLALYLLQGNTQRALQACSALEMLCKRRPIPQSIIKVLLPLGFVPSGIEGIAHMRARLLAALEENQLLHVEEKRQKKEKNAAKEKENPEEKDLPFLEDLFLSIITIIDLKNAQTEMDSRLKLSDDQEWFLFKRFFRHSRSLFDSRVKSSPQLANIIQTIGWDYLLELLALPSELGKRYKILKQKYGKKESFVAQSSQFAMQVQKAPGIVSRPGIPSFKQSGKIGLESNLTNDLIALVKIGTSHQLYNLKNLDLLELRKEILWDLPANSPLTVETLTPIMLKSHFLAYYAIAIGERGAKEKQKLINILKLTKGAWNQQCHILVSYLEAICGHPLFFKKSQHFTEVLQKKPTVRLDKQLKCEEYYPQFEEFFNQLNTRTMMLRMAQKSFSLAESVTMGVAQAAISKTLLQPVANFIPLPWLAFSAVKWGSKVYNAYSANTTMKKIEDTNTVALSSDRSYSHLEEEDRKFDAIFDRLFGMAFKETTSSPDGEKRVVPFESQDKSPATIEKIERINQSVKDYYEREDRTPALLLLKSEEALWELYTNALLTRDCLKEQLEKERSALLALASSKQFGHSQAMTLTFDDLKRFFLKGDFNPLNQLSHLPFEGFGQMELAIARDIVRQTRLQQLERVITCLESLTQLDLKTQPQQLEEKIEQLADELKTRRTYSFKKVPPRLLRRFMIFELISNKMLWKKQSSCILELLTGNHGDVVVELLMSFGKTYFGIPTIDAFEADGKKVVFNIWPLSMVETNTRQIGTQSKQIFDQMINVQRFGRSIPLTAENFESIFVLLQRAMDNGETINMTKEDAQALELILIDYLHRELHQRKSNPERHDVLLQLKAILNIIRWKGKAIGDEAHELFNDVQELNYPIGAKFTIPGRFSLT